MRHAGKVATYQQEFKEQRYLNIGLSFWRFLLMRLTR